MTYHFVKHIGFDVEAENLEQAKEVVKYVDDNDCLIEEDILGIMSTVAQDEFDAHSGNTEFVGVTEDNAEFANTADDDNSLRTEEDFFNYLAGDDCDGDCDHCNCSSDNDNDEFADVIADAIAKAIITLLRI